MEVNGESDLNLLQLLKALGWFYSALGFNNLFSLQQGLLCGFFFQYSVWDVSALMMKHRSGGQEIEWLEKILTLIHLLSTLQVTILKNIS